MNNIELIIDQTAVDTVKNTKLTTNFAEVKTALEEYVKPYESVIVSEDAIATAKSDRAEINRIAKKVDEFRKTVKKAYTEPLTAFEAQCKELVQICGRGTSNIDKQLAEYEEKRKSEKLFLLREYYDNAEKRHPEYMSFELALPDKWELKSQSLDNVKFQMDTIIMRTDKEVESILNLKSEWEISLLDQYKRTHDILDVLALHERLTNMKNDKEQEYKALRESNEPVEIADPNWDATPEPLPFSDDYEPESMYKVSLNAWCTYSQIQAVKEYFKSIGVYIELIDTQEVKVPYTGEGK